MKDPCAMTLTAVLTVLLAMGKLGEPDEDAVDGPEEDVIAVGEEVEADPRNADLALGVTDSQCN